MRQWVKRADEEAAPPSPDALAAAERDELKELRTRVKCLGMEREILKERGLVR